MNRSGDTNRNLSPDAIERLYMKRRSNGHVNIRHPNALLDYLDGHWPHQKHGSEWPGLSSYALGRSIEADRNTADQTGQLEIQRVYQRPCVSCAEQLGIVSIRGSPVLDS